MFRSLNVIIHAFLSLFGHGLLLSWHFLEECRQCDIVIFNQLHLLINNIGIVVTLLHDFGHDCRLNGDLIIVVNRGKMVPINLSYEYSRSCYDPSTNTKDFCTILTQINHDFSGSTAIYHDLLWFCYDCIQVTALLQAIICDFSRFIQNCPTI